VRLSKLNLPTFSGQYDEFSFFNTFKSLIHDNHSIDIQRLQYLRASLTGNIKNLVGLLEVSALNYRVTWNLLKERYHNKRVIAKNYIKAILELPSMTRLQITTDRRWCIKAHRALEVLKRPTSQWDDLLDHILRNKFGWHPFGHVNIDHVSIDHSPD